MITEKFPYIKLSRKTIEGSRHYTCPDGTWVASVTTILDRTKAEASVQALKDWRKRIGHANAADITKMSAGRGTRLHSFLEKYILTDDIGDSGTNPFSIESHTMANCIISNGFSKVTEFYGSEISLHFPQLYAGTTDLIGLYEGEIVIIDFKQSNRKKDESWIDDYFLQLVAYIESHDYMYNTKITRGIIMMCSPPPNMIYQQFEISGNKLEIYKDKWWDRLEKYYSKIL